MCKASRELIDPWERKRKKLDQCGEYPNIPKCGYDELYNRPPSNNQTPSSGGGIDDSLGKNQRLWTNQNYDLWNIEEKYRQDTQGIHSDTPVSKAGLNWDALKVMIDAYDNAKNKSGFPDEKTMEEIKENYNAYLNGKETTQQYIIERISTAYENWTKTNNLEFSVPKFNPSVSEKKEIKQESGWIKGVNLQPTNKELLMFLGASEYLADKIVKEEPPLFLATFLANTPVKKAGMAIDLCETKNTDEVSSILNASEETNLIETNSSDVNKIILEEGNISDIITTTEAYELIKRGNPDYNASVDGGVNLQQIEEDGWKEVVNGETLYQKLANEATELKSFWSQRYSHYTEMRSPEGMDKKWGVYEGEDNTLFFSEHAKRVILGTHSPGLGVDEALDRWFNSPDLAMGDPNYNFLDSLKDVLQVRYLKMAMNFIEASRDTFWEATRGYENHLDITRKELAVVYDPETGSMATSRAESISSMINPETGELTELGQSMWEQGIMTPSNSPLPYDSETGKFIPAEQSDYQRNTISPAFMSFDSLRYAVTGVEYTGDNGNPISPLMCISAVMDALWIKSILKSVVSRVGVEISKAMLPTTGYGVNIKGAGTLIPNEILSQYTQSGIVPTAENLVNKVPLAFVNQKGKMGFTEIFKTYIYNRNLKQTVFSDLTTKALNAGPVITPPPTATSQLASPSIITPPPMINFSNGNMYKSVSTFFKSMQQMASSLKNPEYSPPIESTYVLKNIVDSIPVTFANIGASINNFRFSTNNFSMNVDMNYYDLDNLYINPQVIEEEVNTNLDELFELINKGETNLGYSTLSKNAVNKEGILSLVKTCANTYNISNKEAKQVVFKSMVYKVIESAQVGQAGSINPYDLSRSLYTKGESNKPNINPIHRASLVESEIGNRVTTIGEGIDYLYQNSSGDPLLGVGPTEINPLQPSSKVTTNFVIAMNLENSVNYLLEFSNHDPERAKQILINNGISDSDADKFIQIVMPETRTEESLSKGLSTQGFKPYMEGLKEIDEGFKSNNPMSYETLMEYHPQLYKALGLSTNADAQSRTMFNQLNSTEAFVEQIVTTNKGSIIPKTIVSSPIAVEDYSKQVAMMISNNSIDQLNFMIKTKEVFLPNYSTDVMESKYENLGDESIEYIEKDFTSSSSLTDRDITNNININEIGNVNMPVSMGYSLHDTASLIKEFKDKQAFAIRMNEANNLGKFAGVCLKNAYFASKNDPKAMAEFKATYRVFKSVANSMGLTVPTEKTILAMGENIDFSVQANRTMVTNLLSGNSIPINKNNYNEYKNYIHPDYNRYEDFLSKVEMKDGTAWMKVVYNTKTNSFMLIDTKQTKPISALTGASAYQGLNIMPGYNLNQPIINGLATALNNKVTIEPLINKTNINKIYIIADTDAYGQAEKDILGTLNAKFPNAEIVPVTNYKSLGTLNLDAVKESRTKLQEVLQIANYNNQGNIGIVIVKSNPYGVLGEPEMEAMTQGLFAFEIPTYAISVNQEGKIITIKDNIFNSSSPTTSLTYANLYSYQYEDMGNKTTVYPEFIPLYEVIFDPSFSEFNGDTVKALMGSGYTEEDIRTIASFVNNVRNASENMQTRNMIQLGLNPSDPNDIKQYQNLYGQGQTNVTATSTIPGEIPEEEGGIKGTITDWHTPGILKRFEDSKDRQFTIICHMQTGGDTGWFKGIQAALGNNVNYIAHVPSGTGEKDQARINNLLSLANFDEIIRYSDETGGLHSRTVAGVSDAEVVLLWGDLNSPGMKLTISEAEQNGIKIFDMNHTSSSEVFNYIAQNNVKTILGAGNREYSALENTGKSIQHKAEVDSLELGQMINTQILGNPDFTTQVSIDQLKQNLSGRIEYWNVEEKGYIQIKDLTSNPDKLFLFGDNIYGDGTAGMAVIRDNGNAVGIITMITPSEYVTAYDTDFLNTMFFNTLNSLPKDAIIVVPVDKNGNVVLGRGLADLPSNNLTFYNTMNNVLSNKPEIKNSFELGNITLPKDTQQKSKFNPLALLGFGGVPLSNLMQTNDMNSNIENDRYNIAGNDAKDLTLPLYSTNELNEIESLPVSYPVKLVLGLDALSIKLTSVFGLNMNAAAIVSSASSSSPGVDWLVKSLPVSKGLFHLKGLMSGKEMVIFSLTQSSARLKELGFSSQEIKTAYRIETTLAQIVNDTNDPNVMINANVRDLIVKAFYADKIKTAPHNTPAVKISEEANQAADIYLAEILRTQSYLISANKVGQVPSLLDMTKGRLPFGLYEKGSAKITDMTQKGADAIFIDTVMNSNLSDTEKQKILSYGNNDRTKEEIFNKIFQPVNGKITSDAYYKFFKNGMESKDEKIVFHLVSRVSNFGPGPSGVPSFGRASVLGSTMIGTLVGMTMMGSWNSTDNLAFLANMQFALEGLTDRLDSTRTYGNKNLIMPNGKFTPGTMDDISDLWIKISNANDAIKVWNSQIGVSQFLGGLPIIEGYTLSSEDYVILARHRAEEIAGIAGRVPTEGELKEIDNILTAWMFRSPVTLFNQWKAQTLSARKLLIEAVALGYSEFYTKEMGTIIEKDGKLVTKQEGLSRLEQQKELREVALYYAKIIDKSNEKLGIKIGTNDPYSDQWRWSLTELQEARKSALARHPELKPEENPEFLALYSLTGDTWGNQKEEFHKTCASVGASPFIIYQIGRENSNLYTLLDATDIQENAQILPMLIFDVLPLTQGFSKTEILMELYYEARSNDDLKSIERLEQSLGLPIGFIESVDISLTNSLQIESQMEGFDYNTWYENKLVIVDTALNEAYYEGGISEDYSKTDIKDEYESEIKLRKEIELLTGQSSGLIYDEFGNMIYDPKKHDIDILRDVLNKDEKIYDENNKEIVKPEIETTKEKTTVKAPTELKVKVKAKGIEKIKELENFLGEIFQNEDFNFNEILKIQKTASMLFGIPIYAEDGKTRIGIKLGEGLPSGKNAQGQDLSYAYVKGVLTKLEDIKPEDINMLNLEFYILVAKAVSEEIEYTITYNEEGQGFVDVNEIMDNAIRYAYVKGVYYSRPNKGVLLFGDDYWVFKETAYGLREPTLGVRENWKERFSICRETTDIFAHMGYSAYEDRQIWDAKLGSYVNYKIPILSSRMIQEYKQLLMSNVNANVGDSVVSFVNMYGDTHLSLVKSTLYFPGSHKVYNPRTNTTYYGGVPRDEYGQPLNFITMPSGEGFWSRPGDSFVNTTPGTGCFHGDVITIEPPSTPPTNPNTVQPGDSLATRGEKRGFCYYGG